MERKNALLEPSGAPFGAPRFDLIRPDDYLPAFEEAVRLAQEEVDAIAGNPEPPSFGNTIEALDYAGRALADVEGVFFNLLEADTNPRMQEIAQQVYPLLTRYQMYVAHHEALFLRIKAVYDGPRPESAQQRKLLEDTYQSFVREGAALSPQQKEEFGRIMEELSLAELDFGNRSLAATNAWFLNLENPDDLAGLPDFVVDAGAENAREKGLSGWVYTLQYPSWNPFMSYSTRRDLREKMYRAYAGRALGGANDNTQNILKIVSLRRRVANLLGFPTYADYALDRRMARHRETVEHFLERLMRPSLPKAREELAALLAFARSQGFEENQLQPWDFKFWAERYREAHYSLDQQLLKPYFPLEECVQAVFGLAGTLYGISFRQRKDIPVYHPDVRVYDVLDENGEHLALFYADFFPRESKRQGAWMTEFRGQYARGGVDYRPFISIVANFSKPAAGAPAILSHDELTTLLHEFGHSLHGMLSRGRYPSMCGTSVTRDFVELPSQLMENWAYEPAFLERFARHYKTGEPLPREWIDRIVRARNFLAAYAQVRQLQFGIVDMAWHTLTADPEEDAVSFENRVLAPFRTLPVVEGTAQCPTFGHIFSGGYSAGYYSYKWAEVLEADAFEAFREKGIFDRGVAASFRKNILERGSSEDESVLYRRFRGKDPSEEALLQKLGIIS